MDRIIVSSFLPSRLEIIGVVGAVVFVDASSFLTITGDDILSLEKLSLSSNWF
jgi:hypothetical protein